MKRRAFVALVSGTTVMLLAPMNLRAQETKRAYRVAILSSFDRQAPHWVGMVDELRRFGFVEGANLALISGFGVRPELWQSAARDLIAAAPDAIVAGGAAATEALQRTTAAIPILTVVDDMLASKLVQSLAHPGGNTTGVSMLAPELDGKRQEILIEMIPGLRRMAALADVNTTRPEEEESLRASAAARGVELSIHRIATRAEVASAIDAARQAGSQAVNVLASQLLNAAHTEIVERLASLRMPGMFQWPELAKNGALVGYGPTLASLYRQIARQLVKVLLGTSPAEIPVEQPTIFELAVNLKAAKAIGLSIPQAILDRADEVFE